MPDPKLVNGTFINSFDPSQDTLELLPSYIDIKADTIVDERVVHRRSIEWHFILTTMDSIGISKKNSGRVLRYTPPSDHDFDGNGVLFLHADNDRREWVSRVHIESTNICSHQLILDNFYQYINFSFKEEVEHKVDSLKGVKINANGHPFRFVKCLD